MKRVNPRLVHSCRQTTHDEVVPVPFVFGPPSRDDVRTRVMGHLRCRVLSIDKKLHLNTSPRIVVSYHPSSNRIRRRHCFTPAMKMWRERIHIRPDRNRTHQKRVEYRFCDQHVDEFFHRAFTLRPLRISAPSALRTPFNAEDAEIRRGRREFIPGPSAEYSPETVPASAP